MPRRIATLLAALVAATTVAPLALLAPAPAVAGTSSSTAYAARAEGTDPLQVVIESLSPAVIPRNGPIRIAGTVTNLDTAAWTTVNVYSFVSTTPLTTADEVAAAADLPTETVVGNRVADPEYSDTIDEIAPGDTQQFSFSVPRRELRVTQDGVYWFGVQAIGQGPDGRDNTADGRDLTFMPFVGRGAMPLPVSVVLPLRRQLTYAPDGALDDMTGWLTTLSSGGRLRSMVDLGASAGSRAVTWLVDPALVDAVSQLAAGNPPRSLAPAADPTDPTDPGTPDPATTQSPGAGAASATSDGSSTQEITALQTAAADWLARLGRALPGHQVLALPYGDVDVAGAADFSTQTYTAARKRTGSVLAPYDVPIDPVVSSPGGFLDQAGLDLVDPADVILLTDTMFTGPAPSTDPADEASSDLAGAPAGGAASRRQAGPTGTGDVPTVASDGVHRIVVTSSASTSGPGPGDARSPLAVRQRTLAEAAVRVLSDDPQPLVVMLPHDWNPVSASGFFSGLDVDWLDLMSVGRVATSRPPTSVAMSDLYYPRSQTRTEIDRTGFSAASDLGRTGDVLQNLLPLNDQIGRTIRDQALTSVSYTARSEPLTSRIDTAASTRWVQDRLGSVHVDAPPGFTMTGTEGRFSTSVVNDLDQPVVVDLRAMVTPGIEVSRPRPVEVPANGRTRVLLLAKAPEGGIHRVVIALTDTDGAPLGETDVLNVRALQVGNVIWLFLGAAGALLFGAIAFRLFKRIRAARRASRATPAKARATT